jgi:prophage regulatory protein
MDATHGVDALLRAPEVAHLTGRKRWSLYADIRAGLFTKPVVLGPRAVAWPASEVAALNRARIAGASQSELRTLVLDLHAKRKTPPSDAPGGVDVRPRARPAGRVAAR